jgi:hypothetical protein
MSRRRTAILAGTGVLLAVVGGVMVWLGTSRGPTSLTLAGIAVTLAGLVSLRVVFWARRVRAMTRAGIALSDPDGGKPHPPGGSQTDSSR